MIQESHETLIKSIDNIRGPPSCSNTTSRVAMYVAHSDPSIS